MHKLFIKRVYKEANIEDGYRILVDRLWPRGLSKSEFAMDEWIKALSPSDELRKWFGHEPEKFPEFKNRYVKELSDPAKQTLLGRIAKMAENSDVTLVYSARDGKHNNAIVLAELINKLMKHKVAVA